MFLVRTVLLIITAFMLSACTFAISPLMLILIKNEPVDYSEPEQIRNLPSDDIYIQSPVESRIAIESDFSNFLKV